jgi:hypothetical protein
MGIKVVVSGDNENGMPCEGVISYCNDSINTSYFTFELDKKYIVFDKTVFRRFYKELTICFQEQISGKDLIKKSKKKRRGK